MFTSRAALVLLVLGGSLVGCATGPDDPALAVSDSADGIAIDFSRWSPDHAFTDLHATVDGIELAAPTVRPGHAGSHFTHDDDSYGPSAAYTAPLAQLTGRALEIVVTEDGEELRMHVPDYAAPRALAIAPSLAQPLHLEDALALTSGVASDHLGGFVTLTDARGNTCLGGSFSAADGTLAVPLDATQWSCGGAPGTLVDATLVVDLTAARAVTCDGDPALTCELSAVPLASTTAVQIQL